MTRTATRSNSIQHLPALTVRELDHLDYIAKLRHWMRDDAWQPGGASIRFENPEYPLSSVSVSNGNITKAKPLVGRPCFGIPTALLRYQHATRFVKGQGYKPYGRCHSCKAKDACRWVVNQRLKSVEPITKAWTDWLQEGGHVIFSQPNFKQSYGYRLWTYLCRALQDHPFTSVNDDHVVAVYAERDRVALEKDRGRKAQARRRARRAGELDEADEELLKIAARKRAINLVEYRRDEECPDKLKRIPFKSLKELMQVWLGREILRAKKIKDNAPNIARWIVDDGRSNTSKNHAALSSRVSKDLKRIALLEKLSWRGSIMLPTLDYDIEFPSNT